LGRFVGFEAEIAFLVFVGAGFVAEAGVAEHEVVIGLEIFGVDGECLLEFFRGVGVTFLQEEDAAEFVVDDAITGELGENGFEGLGGFIVVAFLFQNAGVEEIGAGEIGFQGKSFEETTFAPSVLPSWTRTRPTLVQPSKLSGAISVILVKACSAPLRSP